MVAQVWETPKQHCNIDILIAVDIFCCLLLFRDAEVTILDANGHSKVAKILGIDEYGYLQVQKGKQKPETVHPDGNSFDMLQGLITPK